MHDRLTQIFPDGEVHFIPSKLMQQKMKARTRLSNLPVISLDPVYNPEYDMLHVTRITSRELKSIGNGSRTAKPITAQMDRLHVKFAGKEVQLVDDVLFSGDNMIYLIGALRARDIRVRRIVSGITIGDGCDNVTRAEPDVEIASGIHFSKVVDEICERDFWPGVPLSGRLMGNPGDPEPVPLHPEIGVPYLHPFGDATGWASIPAEHADDWSSLCIENTIRLFEEIGKGAGRPVLCSELDRTPIGAPNNSTPFVKYLSATLANFET